MELQLELRLENPHPKAFNLVGIVREIMLANEWITLFEIQKIVLERYGERHSDSTLSARVRDLRKAPYGGYVIERRRKGSGTTQEYRIAGRTQ